MKVVYRLTAELEADPTRMVLAQALTRDKSRPDTGLKGRHGLFASRQWWKNIEEGQMPLLRVSGVICRAYVTGQDEAALNNTIDVLQDDGVGRILGIYKNNKDDIHLFRPGSRLEAVYALDELKQQPADDGGVNYAKVALEMAVSLRPSAEHE